MAASYKHFRDCVSHHFFFVHLGSFQVMPVQDLSRAMSIATEVLRSISFFLAFISIFTDEWLLIDVPSSQPSPHESITDPHWTKEALFGLFSVLLVVLIPCIGLLFKAWLARRRGTKLWKGNPNSMLADQVSSLQY